MLIAILKTSFNQPTKALCFCRTTMKYTFDLWTFAIAAHLLEVWIGEHEPGVTVSVDLERQ